MNKMNGEVLKKYTCINCAKSVDELYRKYNSSVLKLTKCQFCNNIADKYVECDTIIIIIDLVLLSKEAYRHVLCNTEFKAHWKLALLLHIIEAYYDWSAHSINYYKSDEKLAATLTQFGTSDLAFYRICVMLCIRSMCFISVVFVLTRFYDRRRKLQKPWTESLLEVWKSMTLSSFGLFLFLPALIWGSEEIQDYNLSFVVFYTTLSQLFAYKVMNDCSKMWSIFVIIAAHFLSKTYTIKYSATYLIGAIRDFYIYP